ncbi:E3 binding domain-containing protein [Kribbella swartbergensis]
MATASQHVQAEADRLGVALAQVRGTGAGGRISLADVRAAARPSARPVLAAATRRRPTSRMRPMLSPWGGGSPVEIDDYDENPLVTLARALDGGGYGEPPTFFASGNLPPVTASGWEPQNLAGVPWQIRHAAAATPSLPELFVLLETPVEDAAPMVGADDAVGNALGRGAYGWQEYMTRVAAWRVALPPDRQELTAEEWARLFGEDSQKEEVQQDEQA